MAKELKWVKYGDLEVGDCFKKLSGSDWVYMKIETETDHSHFYVTIIGAYPGHLNSPLLDDVLVVLVNLEI